MKNSQKGFVVPLLIGIIALLVIGGGVYIYENKKADAPLVVANTTHQSNQPTETVQNNTAPVVTEEKPLQKKPEIISPTPTPTPTSIDQASLDEGWQVVALGSGQVTKDNYVFSVTIKDLGQTVETDQVFGFQCGTSYCDKRTTQGKFIRVDIAINNPGLENITIGMMNQREVFDQNGRMYEPLLTRNACNNDQYNFWTINPQALKPNIPCIIKALYEVSQDSKSFTAKLDYKKGN